MSADFANYAIHELELFVAGLWVAVAATIALAVFMYRWVTS